MKIWTSDTLTPTHRLVKIYSQEHSGYTYIGDLDDQALRDLLLEIDKEIDIEKNIQLLRYYGYLNLFVIQKRAT
jgi:hypothetical protein